MPWISAFAGYIERLPQHIAPTAQDEATQFAEQVLDAAIGVPTSTTDLVEQLERRRVANEFWSGSEIETYALETQLIKRSPTGAAMHVTALGRVFLRLRGKDGVRWLLTSEILQSRGSDDPWRVEDWLLKEALSEDGYAGWRSEEGERALQRVVELGVLYEARYPYFTSAIPAQTPYRVETAMRDIVAAVVAPGPWHATISAMLEDEGATSVGVSVPVASDAVLEHSRMVLHELNNALLPVRIQLSAITNVVPENLRKPLEMVRGGVMRVLDFGAQMVKLAELTREPLTVTDFTKLSREAISLVDGGDVIEEVPPTLPISLRAPRSRFVLALVNLLRNAIQAAGTPPRVRLSALLRDGAVHINVDDNGAGVPAEERERIFRDGYTTRPGGTGFGLAYVRRVVEGDLHGKVWCEDSDLGGARFSIEIPSKEPTR